MDLLIKGIDGQYYFKDEYDEAKVLDKKNVDMRTFEEILKNSPFIRESMGLDPRAKAKKKKEIGVRF